MPVPPSFSLARDAHGFYVLERGFSKRIVHWSRWCAEPLRLFFRVTVGMHVV